MAVAACNVLGVVCWLTCWVWWVGCRCNDMFSDEHALVTNEEQGRRGLAVFFGSVQR